MHGSFARLILGNLPVPHREAINRQDRSITWAGLQELAVAIRQRHDIARRRVGLSFDGSAEACAALAVFDDLQCDTFLLDATLSVSGMLELAREFRLGALVVPSSDGRCPDLAVHRLHGEAGPSGQSTITILTSGSTGRPKAVRHSWAGLIRPVRKTGERSAARWLLTYRPHLYAGFQVVLQCFANYGTLVIPGFGADPLQVVRLMLSAGVQYVSATPSYWKRILILCDRERLREIPLLQLTLGGEIADQALLDELKRTFPCARVVHIYATTELGRCFSVTDGVAGFPATYLDGISGDGVRLKVHDGELFVRSANAMLRYDPLSSSQSNPKEWFETGDLVEISGGRARFVGRKADIVNVGGQKVHPLEIERVIRVIPGVADARVFGRASSLMGQVVACEVVPDKDQDPDALKEAVTRACRSRLSPAQQPRFVQMVTHIDLSVAGKTLRGIAQ